MSCSKWALKKSLPLAKQNDRDDEQTQLENSHLESADFTPQAERCGCPQNPQTRQQTCFQKVKSLEKVFLALKLSLYLGWHRWNRKRSKERLLTVGAVGFSVMLFLHSSNQLLSISKSTFDDLSQHCRRVVATPLLFRMV